MRLQVDYSSVAAFERSKQPQRKHSTLSLFTAILLAVFFVALMGGLAAGVSMYRSVTFIQTATNDVRIESGLMASLVHVNDAANAVATGEGPEGRSLVFVENLESGSYETRVYLYQGHVVQEYSVAGTSYTPERAQELVPSGTFEFAYNGRLIHIRTDQGTFDIAVRSEQGVR